MHIYSSSLNKYIFFILCLLKTASIIAAASCCQDDAPFGIEISRDIFLTTIKDHGREGVISLLNMHTEKEHIVIPDTVARWNEASRSFPKHAESLSPLLCALHNQELEIALALLREFPCYLHKTDSRGNTALHYYCKSKCQQPEDEISILDRTLIGMMKPLLNIPNHILTSSTPNGIYPVALGRNYHLLVALGLQGATINKKTMTGRQYWNGYISQILHTFMKTQKKSDDPYVCKEIEQIIHNETVSLFAHEAGGESIARALRARENGSLSRYQSRFNQARSAYAADYHTSRYFKGF